MKKIFLFLWIVSIFLSQETNLVLGEQATQNQRTQASELILSLKTFYKNHDFFSMRQFAQGPFKDFVSNILFIMDSHEKLPPILEDQMLFTEDIRWIDEQTYRDLTFVSVLWVLRYPDSVVQRRKLMYRLKAIEFQYILKKEKSKWFIIDFKKANENNLYDHSLKKIKK